ncbi:DsrE family protein [Cecembia calidifontis]|uniref:Uncharacterized protein n=1 Tax=Cecembia calidifontis TaxID=1187080 RepID=A0A4V2F6G2_9BACT|nr:DsrE family protein [Cecembia calidifontis]RZS96209.1 hypothetical protein BC751_1775 [Cecembia calidifontis]
MLKHSILLFLLFISSQLTAQVVSNEPHQIIFQLVDGDSTTHSKFIRQLNNILEAAPNAKIEVVTHGMGVDLLKIKNNPFENPLKQLKERGVEFVVCENTLKQRNMKKEQFLPLAGFVPSAILELVMKQEKGWIYIKAGG